jgi:hypothetical protein
MRDPSKYDVRDPRVYEIKMCQVSDCRALKGAIPGVRALQVRSKRQVPQGRFILVKYSPHLAHIREPVVVLRAERKLA